MWAPAHTHRQGVPKSEQLAAKLGGSQRRPIHMKRASEGGDFNFFPSARAASAAGVVESAARNPRVGVQTLGTAQARTNFRGWCCRERGRSPRVVELRLVDTSSAR